MGNPDENRYGYLDSNWESFNLEKEMFGIWGYVDETSGNMNSLGFVFKDKTCVGTFLDEVGVNFSWTSIAPGVKVIKETGAT